MKVDHVLETPVGTLTFKGELSQKELDAVVTVGLNYLLLTGALVNMKNEETPSDVTVN